MRPTKRTRPTSRRWRPALEVLEDRNLLSSYTFTKIVDTTTPIAGGDGPFTRLDAPSLDNGTVVFRGGRGGFHGGIYSGTGTSLTTLVDTNTDIPGGTGKFAGLAGVFYSYDNGALVFNGGGHAPESQGLWLREPTGELSLVVSRNTPAVWSTPSVLLGR